MGIIQLRFNLKVAPGGEPPADVSGACSEYRLVTAREGVTVPANGATGRGSTAAGVITESIVFTMKSGIAAADFLSTLREAIYTDSAEIDFEGTFDPGVVSADNPLYSGTATLLNFEIGGTVGALRGQTLTCPVTEAGITVVTTPA